jgi:hypothetical protein
MLSNVCRDECGIDPINYFEPSITQCILSFLDPQALALCEVVSKAWLEAASNNELWSIFIPEGHFFNADHPKQFVAKFCSVEGVFQKRLGEIKEKNRIVSSDLRLDVFKYLMYRDAVHPEKVCSPYVREFFNIDLDVMKRNLEQWKNKSDLAQKALANIDAFLECREIPGEISFRDHAYYFFCLAAIISGIDPNDVDEEYNKQMHTMVKGVVHPSGEWTPRSEIENQDYAKFIFHVSKTGLASVNKVNEMNSLRLNANSPFCAIRLVAVACAETVGFDGIEDCGALAVLIHDFIHAGFMKYAFHTNQERFIECLEKLGVMHEEIQRDPDLPQESILKKQVEAAFFMWTHELTTSIFVHGWPRRLPKSQPLLGGTYASAPQILLRWGAKFNLLPQIFAKEIETEMNILSSLGLELQGLTDSSMSEHDKIKEVMDHLNCGYAYLHTKFGEYYGHQNLLKAAIRRYIS